MDILPTVVGVIAMLLMVGGPAAVCRVPEGHAGIIVRGRRYRRTVGSGRHLVLPFLELMLTTVDLGEHTVWVRREPLITADNLAVPIDAGIHVQVTDPGTTYQATTNYQGEVRMITVTALRNAFCHLTAEDALTSRDVLTSAVRKGLAEHTTPLGLQINRVEIETIGPITSIEEAFRLLHELSDVPVATRRGRWRVLRSAPPR